MFETIDDLKKKLDQHRLSVRQLSKIYKKILLSAGPIIPMQLKVIPSPC